MGVGGGFGNVIFPLFSMPTFNGNFVNCTLVGRLSRRGLTMNSSGGRTSSSVLKI